MTEQILKQIKVAAESIRYGSIEIVIHDSKIVQIEKKEKLRFENGSNSIQPTDRASGSSL